MKCSPGNLGDICMLDTLFSGLFDSELTTVIAVQDFLLCVGCALVIGLILAGCYMYRTRYTRGFVATLALLPAVVCVVIMMVNGNVAPAWLWQVRSAWYGSALFPDQQRKFALSFSPWALA